MQNVILDDKDFFEWLKTKQTNGKLTQTQVDGGAELLAVVKPDVLQECLAKSISGIYLLMNSRVILDNTI